MLINPNATRVLCYGDSNTHGAQPDDTTRWPIDIRWTGQLQQRLGDDYDVIEEGLGGRTTDLDQADRPGGNGRAYLTPCLLSHCPLDIIVLMLGTNDVKARFDRPVERIAEALGGLVDDIRSVAYGRDGHVPTIVVVTPVPVDDRAARFAESSDEYDLISVAKSRGLAAAYREFAEAQGLLFADAGAVGSVGADGVHLDAASHGRIAEMISTLIVAH
ncbi:GDSL-type esterase/lipase family protein [Nocardia sp. NPDC051570]|uniref:GDSL-type esterase/lipase family protein n=1 Tax=Nocardia sp. NPDC051570 TaxID=3364324 RepID=UPI00379F94C1